jgi:glycosyltransferase involved in cell wall biosynthesis
VIRPPVVVHVITKLELGGAQENTLFTVANLDRRRFQAALLHGPGGILDAEAAALPETHRETMPHLIREIRPASDLLAYRELRRSLDGIRKSFGGPMIVHTHSSKAGILGRFAARAAGAAAVVHSIHGYGFHDRQAWPVRRAYIALEKMAAGATDAFIAVSRANLEEGLRLGLFPPGKATLIRSGFPLDRFARPARDIAALRGELGIPPGAPVVGMVACLKPQKAPEDFVEAAARVVGRFPEARFLLVGDGELRPAVEAAVRRRGLQRNMLLTGWRRDVPDLMHLMDVVVLTSRWEGLPRVVPQAMAAGKPVVATAVNGTPEAVADGVTGFLAAAGDVATIADRVARLLADPAMALLMGDEGRRRVSEFDAASMVRLQEELYDRLLAGGR